MWGARWEAGRVAGRTGKVHGGDISNYPARHRLHRPPGTIPGSLRPTRCLGATLWPFWEVQAARGPARRRLCGESQPCSQRSMGPQILGQAPSPDMDREAQSAPEALLRDQSALRAKKLTYGQCRQRREAGVSICPTGEFGLLAFWNVNPR